MATFKRFQASVGSQQSAPAPTTVYTVPSSKTSVITGLTVSNVSEFELPVDIFITVGSDTTTSQKASALVLASKSA